jgi:hypothetical protein
MPLLTNIAVSMQMAGDDGETDFAVTLMDSIADQITATSRAMSLPVPVAPDAAAAAASDSGSLPRPDVHGLCRCISMSIVAAARVHPVISAGARKSKTLPKTRARLSALKRLTNRVKVFALAHHVDMNGRALANVTRSLVDLHWPVRELLDIMAERLLQHPNHFNCVEAGMVIGTFARAGYHPGRRIVEMVCKQVDAFFFHRLVVRLRVKPPKNNLFSDHEDASLICRAVKSRCSGTARFICITHLLFLPACVHGHCGDGM